MPKGLSICITVKNRSRGTCSRRPLQLFPRCMLSLVHACRILQECGFVEIVSTDWQSDDWPLMDWLPKLDSPVPIRVGNLCTGLSRGMGRNFAAQGATFDNLFFLDADMLVSDEALGISWFNARRGVATFPVVYGYTDQEHLHLVKFGPEATGNCCVTRSMWEAVGGFPEKRVWGGEDVDFLHAIERRYPVERPDAPGLIHQWHPDKWRSQYDAEGESHAAPGHTLFWVTVRGQAGGVS